MPRSAIAGLYGSCTFSFVKKKNCQAIFQSGCNIIFFSFFKKLYIYLFLAVLGHCCCLGYSLVAMRRLLVVVASRCRAQVLGCRGSVVAGPELQSTGSEVVAHGLSCSKAREIFPHQESHLRGLPHRHADS